MRSDINPFDSQETKPYKNDPRISAMTDLVDAYQRDDIHRYESVLQNNRDVWEDPFIAENIDEVTRNMRTKGVLKLIAPYTRFTLRFIANQLKISIAEVQDILGFLIVDKKLRGKINEEEGTVEIEGQHDVSRTQSMRQWTGAVESLWKTMLDEGDGFRTEEVPNLGGSASMQIPRLEGGASLSGWQGSNGLGGRRGPGNKAFATPAAQGSLLSK